MNVGESRSLECTISMAKPAATIVWYRGNFQIKGGEMTITPVSIDDGKFKGYSYIYFKRLLQSKTFLCLNTLIGYMMKNI